MLIQFQDNGKNTGCESLIELEFWLACRVIFGVSFAEQLLWVDFVICKMGIVMSVLGWEDQM